MPDVVNLIKLLCVVKESTDPLYLAWIPDWRHRGFEVTSCWKSVIAELLFLGGFQNLWRPRQSHTAENCLGTRSFKQLQIGCFSMQKVICQKVPLCNTKDFCTATRHQFITSWLPCCCCRSRKTCWSDSFFHWPMYHRAPAPTAGLERWVNG